MSARHLMTTILGYAPTDEQLAMIEADEPATLVVAGAGSGKTETMANRVVWLCARPGSGRVRPEEVLGLTFTRKAAGELAARVATRLRQAARVPEGAHLDGAEVGQPTILTYDAYAGRLVREHGLRLGVEPDTELLAESAVWQLAHDVVARYEGPTDHLRGALSTVVSGVLSLAGQLAEHLADPDEVIAVLERQAVAAQEHATNETVRAMVASLRGRAQLIPVIGELTARMRRLGVMDFAQQKAVAARLARDVPQVREIELARYRAVLLDEFQDTSENQLVMLSSLFAGSTAQVTAVGDPHQSIYGWRGASATTLTAFAQRFAVPRAPVRTLSLATSWRNDTAILDAANAVAGPLREGEPGVPQVPVAPLRARPGAGTGQVSVLQTQTQEDELARMARWIADRGRAVERSRPRGTGPASAAVLCRRRAHFDPVVRALQDAGLPYEVVGLGGLLTMPEVADLVALLTVVQDPGRGDRLMRLLTGSFCRLGAADLDGLAAWASALCHDPRASAALAIERSDDGDDRATLVEALTALPRQGWAAADGRTIGPVARERLDHLAAVISRVRAATGLALPELVLLAERELGLDVEVLARPGTEGMAGRRHLDAFLDEVAGYAATSDRPSLGGLVAWLDAAMERDGGLEPGQVEPAPGVVQVLTVHAAKGLEWDVVAVPGLAEGVFPSHGARVTPHATGWRMSAPTDSGWLTGLGDLPFALRGDRAGLPAADLVEASDRVGLTAIIDGFKQAHGRHGIYEERRLAYVALTRARQHLLLSSSLWVAGRKSPFLTSRFLHEVRDTLGSQIETLGWAELPEGPSTNPLPEEAPAVPWPRPVDDGTVAALESAAAAVRDAARRAAPPDETTALLLAEADEGRRGMARVEVPRRLSASAALDLIADPDAFHARLRRPVPREPRAAALGGTLLHARIERHFRDAALIAWPDGLEDEPSAPVSDALWERFSASEWAARTPVDVERAVFTTIGTHRITARIDAVFEVDSELVVVDWKTGREPHGDELATRALQLAQYRVAYARYAGVPSERVRACFYYLSTGRTVWPELPGEEELEALLAR